VGHGVLLADGECGSLAGLSSVEAPALAAILCHDRCATRPPQLIALVCALHALVLWLGLEHRTPSDASKAHPSATLAGEQLGRPEASAQAALQNGMASAARSDCLKGGGGGYAGQGLGLFALPLLAVDLARGRCAK